METLVPEICCLCIRRNLVDRMIELPWSAYEEKHLHKCLLDFAAEDPSTTVGSLLIVFYLQVRELAEKESDNEGVFKMLRSDVTRFLATILIGTTIVNIAATTLVTEAATAAFGEAGVSTATGFMTVAILLLTKITPKSIAIHNATEVSRFVVRPVAWLSSILYPVGRVVTYLSMGMLKLLGFKGRKLNNWSLFGFLREVWHQLTWLYRRQVIFRLWGYSL